MDNILEGCLAHIPVLYKYTESESAIYRDIYSLESESVIYRDIYAVSGKGANSEADSFRK